MKVAVFVDELSATGVVNNAIAVAGDLHARGCDVRLVAARAEGTLKPTVPEEVPVVGLLPPGQVPSSRPRRLVRTLRAYRGFVGDFAPDVLFSSGNHAHLASLFAAGAAPKCRTVVRISNDLRHAVAGRRRRNPVPRWLRETSFRLIAERADRLVFVSDHLRRQAAASVDLAEKGVVIPNGVDLTAIHRRAQEHCPHDWLSQSDPVVLAVGRLVRQKNLHNLIRAVALARNSRPLRLLLLGSGPLRDSLLREAEALGIGGAVEILPPVPNPIPYIDRSSVLALPSWWEGSSNVLLEALACETPIVASDTAGSAAEVLDEGRFGLLVNPTDVRAMADALVRQSSASAIRPGARAEAFSRDAALGAYASLILKQG